MLTRLSETLIPLNKAMMNILRIVSRSKRRKQEKLNDLFITINILLTNSRTKKNGKVRTVLY
jgi:hypothetical protein